jgi:hypothetical protein
MGKKSDKGRDKSQERSPRGQAPRQPVVEDLEPRILLSTFTVANTADAGEGSLRQALLDANSNAGADVIEFQIDATDPGHVYAADDGVAGSLQTTTELGDAEVTDLEAETLVDVERSWDTIKLQSPLPDITDTVTIDGTSQPGWTPSNPVIELDAALAGAGPGLSFAEGSDGSTVQGLVLNPFGEAGIELLPSVDPDAERRTELVFVDTGVEGYQALVDELRRSTQEGRSLEVFLLDTQRDGIEQISDILSDYQGVDAVHIVSHGSEGAAQLGDTWLSSDTLTSYESDLASWADALSEDADLLFYGCNLAGGERGEALVDSIAKLTGADVAASDDLTGAEALAGDWELEYQAGSIESDTAVGAVAQQSYLGVLANTAPVNTVPGPQTTAQDTSVRFSSTDGNAIAVSDADAGNNEIEVTLSVDSGTLTLHSTVAVGSETRLNSTASGLQSEPDVAYAADGSYVTVWQDSNGLDGDLAGVYGQRFDADGNKVGGEFLVNTTTASSQFNAAIAMDDAGNFTVAFTHRTNGGSTQIYAQRFDSLAVKQGGEFTVNNQSKGNQFLSDVAMDPSGNFVVAWYGNGAGDDEGAFIQRYDAAGNELGGETLVNTMATDDQQFPRLAMNDTGDFVVVWQSTLQDGSGTGIYGQRFDSGGVVQGAEFLINTTTASSQMTASVSMDATGNFVVVWQSNLQDGSGYGVFGQRYDSAGNTLGGEFQINDTTAGSQQKANVAMTATGEFVVAWAGQNQAGDGSDYAIVARRYDATGSAVSGELLVNTTTSGAQSDPNVDIRDNGDFVVAWSGNGPGDADGVFFQRFTAVPLTFSVGDGIADATMTFTGTIADINTALQGLTYSPNGGYNGIDTLTITTNDLGNTGTGGALQDVDNVQITVGNPNAPVIDLNGVDGGTNDFAAAWAEGGGGVALVDADGTLIDADENLSMVVVSIANLRQAGIEMLAADTSGTSLVASYNAGTGVLTISGTGTAAEYQQVLRTVTY